VLGVGVVETEVEGLNGVAVIEVDRSGAALEIGAEVVEAGAGVRICNRIDSGSFKW
jgi:hypothetical protein